MVLITKNPRKNPFVTCNNRCFFIQDFKLCELYWVEDEKLVCIEHILPFNDILLYTIISAGSLGVIITNAEGFEKRDIACLIFTPPKLHDNPLHIENGVFRKISCVEFGIWNYSLLDKPNFMIFHWSEKSSPLIGVTTERDDTQTEEEKRVSTFYTCNICKERIFLNTPFYKLNKKSNLNTCEFCYENIDILLKEDWTLVPPIERDHAIHKISRGTTTLRAISKDHILKRPALPIDWLDENVEFSVFNPLLFGDAEGFIMEKCNSLFSRGGAISQMTKGVENYAIVQGWEKSRHLLPNAFLADKNFTKVQSLIELIEKNLGATVFYQKKRIPYRGFETEDLKDQFHAATIIDFKGKNKHSGNDFLFLILSKYFFSPLFA
eukprot:TRINITY_DN3398_c0_g1_i4.p1 TRINITY_DN3398_c0_g1~~TRINITY_DN3398_c0_g1_i4.p1  ORF type:complete len:379 (+),score=72.72 TRINITY_DN3398_c0_g1_i4:548-1684(+)